MPLREPPVLFRGALRPSKTQATSALEGDSARPNLWAALASRFRELVEQNGEGPGSVWLRRESRSCATPSNVTIRHPSVAVARGSLRSSAAPASGGQGASDATRAMKGLLLGPRVRGEAQSNRAGRGTAPPSKEGLDGLREDGGQHPEAAAESGDAASLGAKKPRTAFWTECKPDGRRPDFGSESQEALTMRHVSDRNDHAGRIAALDERQVRRM